MKVAQIKVNLNHTIYQEFNLKSNINSGINFYPGVYYYQPNFIYEKMSSLLNSYPPAWIAAVSFSGKSQIINIKIFQIWIHPKLSCSSRIAE